MDKTRGTVDLKQFSKKSKFPIKLQKPPNELSLSMKINLLNLSLYFGCLIERFFKQPKGEEILEKEIE